MTPLIENAWKLMREESKNDRSYDTVTCEDSLTEN